MSKWVLLGFIFLAWFVQLVAALYQRELEGARRGLPPGQRGGVSCLPVIPLLPLALWGLALLIDLVAHPWGTWVVGSLHVVLLAASVVSIARDRRHLRRLGGR